MRISIIVLLFFTFTSAFAFPAKPEAKKMQRLVDKSLEFCISQSLRMYDTVKDIPEVFPNITKNGEFDPCISKYWTSGFFPGELWYLYEYSGAEEIRKAAEVMTERVLKEQFNTTSHDVGFMIYCSAGNGFRLTHKEEYRTAVINAGNSLSTRFNPAVGCTRSWKPRPEKGWDFVVIADNLMNLELLTVSSALTGDLNHFRIAKIHADTTLENHFRSDYGTYHVVNYDSITGKVISRQTSQGYSDESTWSRGQAWALYGYTMMYRQTGEKRYLDQAFNVADFIIDHKNLPKDNIPYWDFDAPAGKDTPRDASAAAINASALIELSQYTDDNSLSSKYLRFAEKTLQSLSSKTYLAKPGENFNFVLMHSTANMPKNKFDSPWIVADYYYIEALMRYKRLLEGCPVVDVKTVVTSNQDRQHWISTIDRIARPMLTHLAEGTLRRDMPVESIYPDTYNREGVSHLEGLARTLMGIAPWLELGPDNTPEGKLRAEYIDLACKAITQAMDPSSPDSLSFCNARQCKVDAANFALGLLRAPEQLWNRLDTLTKERIIEKLKSSRSIETRQSNWLNFDAVVEAALLTFTGECDMKPIYHLFDCFKQEFYKGDGWYGDGKMFHMDYYNSYVIQPMMMTVLDVLAKKGIVIDYEGKDFREIAQKRYGRYAAVQERFISPEGTYPFVGRSSCYRMGAFQGLSDASFRHLLPENIDPAQVRCALTAVMKRQLGAPGTFDAYGWLRPGFSGHQPHIGERYISTGSLYLVCSGFIALGLPESDPFWSNPSADWTSKKAWEGVDLPADKAIKF